MRLALIGKSQIKAKPNIELKLKFINFIEVSCCPYAYYYWKSMMCCSMGEWNYNAILS